MMQTPTFGNRSLHWADYVIFALTIVGSISIGVYYAVKERHRTTEDYLIAGRKMSVLPASMSLMISFLSAITLLGDAAENYFYGISYSLYIFSSFFSALIVAYVFVPLFYPLRITSIQDYLLMRYGTMYTVYISYVFQMLLNIVICGLFLYGPAVMLYTVSGFPMWASILLIGVASTFYSTIGGFKGVIWTDAFQTVVIMGALLVIAIKGTIEAGGVKNVWQRFHDGGRLHTIVDMNPMNRLDMGTILFIHIFHRIGMYGVQQTSVQRYCSLSSLKAAQLSVLLVTPLLTIVAFLAGYSGVVAYGYYSAVGCDPYRGGFINSLNEILPYFVMNVIGVPGIPGLFVACVFCGSLSSLSSSFSSVSAMTWEDIFKHRKFFADLPETRKTLVTKLIVLVYGIVVTGMGFSLTKMRGSIIKMAFTIIGPLFPATVLIIFLGAAFPRINSKSAVAGTIIGFAAAAWVAIGAQTIPSQHQPLPTITTNCSMYRQMGNGFNSTVGFNGSVIPQRALDEQTIETFAFYEILFNETLVTPTPKKQLNGIEKLYAMSHMWYSFFGIVIGTVCALLLSLIPGFYTREVDPKCLFHAVRYLTCRTMDEEDHAYKDVPMDDKFEKNGFKQ